jgi:hypothetical protein
VGLRKPVDTDILTRWLVIPWAGLDRPACTTGGGIKRKGRAAWPPTNARSIGAKHHKELSLYQGYHSSRCTTAASEQLVQVRQISHVIDRGFGRVSESAQNQEHHRGQLTYGDNTTTPPLTNGGSSMGTVAVGTKGELPIWVPISVTENPFLQVLTRIVGRLELLNKFWKIVTVTPKINSTIRKGSQWHEAAAPRCVR